MTTRKPNIGYKKGGKQSWMPSGCQAYENRIEILLAVKWMKVEFHTGLWKNNESLVATMCTIGKMNAWWMLSIWYEKWMFGGHQAYDRRNKYLMAIGHMIGKTNA
jgi:hypothetical protein